MTAPSFVAASTGFTDAGGVWVFNSDLSPTVGNICILQILQDGATAGATTLTTVGSRLEDLAGTNAALTSIGSFQVGGTSLAIQYLWIGRCSTAGIVTVDGGNSTSEDLYMRFYEFADCGSGATLATVIENATAGSTVNSTGTSATVSDASVTTLDVDRLAVNFLAINDDNPFAGFTGQSGGTWTTRASYADATGTDGAIYLIDAAMASAGTIDGGTGSITDSDAWGVLGFALIGTTVAVDRVPYVTPMPQLLAQ